jgi:paraquat-inducible protein A
MSEKFFYFDSTFDFFNSLELFWELKEYFLFFLVLIFTLVFPATKYVFLILNRLLSKQWMASLLSKITKWSMLDVFVVAVMLLAFKMDSGIIQFKIEVGTYYIAISVLLSLLIPKKSIQKETKNLL